MFQYRRDHAPGITSNVAGVGDEAYFESDAVHGSTLTVRKGDRVFILNVLAKLPADQSNSGLAAPKQAKSRLVQLAQVLLGGG